MGTNSNGNQDTFTLLAGTYTDNTNRNGIYIFEFNAISGDLKLIGNTENVINPGYLSVAADNKYVYAVNENEVQPGLSAFAYNSKEGTLHFINKRDTGGASPCHLINDNHNVIVANYAGGSIAVFKKMPDQGIAEACQLIQHKGKGINPKRQEKPHVHMVCFSPDNKFVLANDLGLDKIFIYKYDPQSADLVLALTDTIDLKPGSGPRHSVFSRDGNYMFLLHELDGTLATLRYDDGSLNIINETNITPSDFKGEISAAAVKIAPDGKFLYVSDRGLNTISVYKTEENGTLDYVERISTGGKEPRDFAMDPLGNFLLVGHQETNSIDIFRRNKLTGKLTATGKRIKIESPVNLVFTET